MEGGDTSDVVDVAMSENDAVKRIQRNPGGIGPGAKLATADAAIDQEHSSTAYDTVCVAFAAAGKRCDFHVRSNALWAISRR